MPAETSSAETPNRARRMRVAVSVAMMAAGLAAPLAPAMAQVTTVDPDAAIDSDIGRPPQNAAPVQQAPEQQPVEPQDNGMPVDQGQGRVAPPPAAAPIPPRSPSSSDTYHQDDLIGAAEGVFGKGAKGLAELIEGLLKKQGEPNGYIIGREAGGAFAVGLRYGSGTLFHKVEGEQPVYWTGPSLGFDAGANAGNAFVLVYNLYDSEDLYHRFGAGEGQAYLVGGFTVSYLRRGNVVLIPVRAGAGLRLGANIGYMKFSHKQNWLPF